MPKKSIKMEVETPTGAPVEETTTPNQSADLSAILAQLKEQNKMIQEQAQMIAELK